MFVGELLEEVLDGISLVEFRLWANLSNLQKMLEHSNPIKYSKKLNKYTTFRTKVTQNYKYRGLV